MWRKREKKPKKPALILRVAWHYGWKPGRVVREILEWLEVLVVAGALALLIMTFVTVRMHVPTGSMIPTIDIKDSFFVDRITYYFRHPKPGDIVVFHHERSIRIQSVAQGSAADAAGMSAGEYLTYSASSAVYPGLLGSLTVYTEDAIHAYLETLPEGSRVTLRTAEGNSYDLGTKAAGQTSLEDFGLRLRIKKQMYVKRLIAVGGQTVQITGGDIVVDGVKLEGSLFDRYYYSNDVRFQYGIQPTQVPEGHYFMLGDNSGDSLDSRYWGFVPQKDIVGVPYLRVWPLDRIGIM